MRVLRVRFVSGFVLLATPLFAADPGANQGSRPQTSRTGGAGRGVLPDPALLDGSAVPAEKKGEFGMIGDFELPGESEGGGEKVGGGSGPQEAQQPAAGGSGLAGAGGGAGEQGKPGSGKPGSPGAGAEGKEGTGAASAGDPQAKAEGVRVAQLGGDASGAVGAEAGSQKPPQVAIGDAAMRIPQNNQPASAVVGAQQVAGANTQVYEKGTGTGGKGPAGKQGANRTEKGRAIPAGL